MDRLGTRGIASIGEKSQARPQVRSGLFPAVTRPAPACCHREAPFREDESVARSNSTWFAVAGPAITSAVRPDVRSSE
jgi:hypothetical protein